MSSTNPAQAERYYFNGDLNQMSAVLEALRQADIPVVSDGGYAVVVGAASIQRALQFVWERRIDGWWNERKRLLELEICTQEQFNTALDQQIAARKQRESAEARSRMNNRYYCS